MRARRGSVERVRSSGKERNDVGFVNESHEGMGVRTRGRSSRDAGSGRREVQPPERTRFSRSAFQPLTAERVELSHFHAGVQFLNTVCAYKKTEAEREDVAVW